MDPDVEIADININLKELEDQEDYVENESQFFEEIEFSSYKKYKKEKFDKSIFEISKSLFENLENMLGNCESYTDIITKIIKNMYFEALKAKLK